MATLHDAMSVYKDSRALVDSTVDIAETDDLIGWLRDDLAEAAMDLKFAVIDLDQRRVQLYMDECQDLAAAMLARIREIGGESEA